MIHIATDWIHPRLIVVITAMGKESADRLKNVRLALHNLVMILETRHGPNVISRCKQESMMTAVLK